jgi:predicted HicB family RNase H-like nuclease
MAKKQTVWQANQVVLRVEAPLKAAMVKAAAKDGRSMNAWAERALAEAVGLKLRKG